LANLVVNYDHDERVIATVHDYHLPPWREFRRDVLALALDDTRFRRNRKRRPVHVVADTSAAESRTSPQLRIK
jgi:hypothetical protein